MSIESMSEGIPPSERKPSILADIEPIGESRNTLVKTRDQLRALIESPLLSACEELYDKNIRTLSTSANRENIQFNNAHILIDYDSLSEENTEIAKSVGKVVFADNTNQLLIPIPINEHTTPEEIQSFSEAIAHKFKKQNASWIPAYTLKQLRTFYGIDPEDNNYTPEVFSEHFYLDKETNLFYFSKEHAEKVREEIPTTKT